MADASTPRIACPSCAKKYAWKQAAAGRKVRCTQCEAIFLVPETPHGDVEMIQPPPERREDDGTYELALPEDDDRNEAVSGPASAPSEDAASPASHDGKCPSCNNDLKPGAVICMNCGYNLKTGSKMQTEVAADPGEAEGPAGNAGGGPLPDFGPSAGKLDTAALAEDSAREMRFKSIFLPLILIGIGLALTLLNAAVLAPLAFQASGAVQQGGGSGAGMWAVAAAISAVYAAARLVVQVPMMLGAVFLVAAIFGTSFGSIWSAILKLIAIAIVTGGVNDGIGYGLDILTGGFGGIGWFLQLSIILGVFYILATWLLETEPIETIVIWGITIFGPMVAMIFIGTLLYAMLG